MRVLVREHPERSCADVVGAYEGNLAISAGRVDLAFVLDGLNARWILVGI